MALTALTKHVSSPNPVEWYRDQVIFLTGATGNLGGCLLYKLALQLPTAKIFVLCRGSMRQAMEKWEATMPDQIEDILDTGKVACITGDITHPQLGLGRGELETLQQEVTLVIHAAANISFLQTLPESVRENSVPIIELARLLDNFQKIKTLLYVSSIATRSFLPGGLVTEDTDRLFTTEDDAETQVASIEATGSSPYTDPQYMVKIQPNVPYMILLVRPSNIGPAIQNPYPLYGPEGAIPTHTVFQLVFETSQERTLEAFNVSLPKDLIVEEIPVDLVANVCLVHVAADTSGVVHAGSELYTTVTFGEYAKQAQIGVPRGFPQRICRARVRTSIATNLASLADNLLGVAWRGDWQVDCSRSRDFRKMQGPIGLDLSCHDFDDFSRKRILHLVNVLGGWMKNLEAKQ
ncbi:male sterility protein-domain-containing protein [Aspergillus keveii]|uniref:Fatty acyl-CoA reductase n=1 Tax=Aspergillus keveii TaxID=714993 RepID=A0ABR4G2C8_9EURO